jgi:hypothetical protein
MYKYCWSFILMGCFFMTNVASINAQNRKETQKDIQKETPSKGIDSLGMNKRFGYSKILIDTTFSSDGFGGLGGGNFHQFFGGNLNDLNAQPEMKKMMQLLMQQMQGMHSLDPKQLEKLFEGFNFGEIMPPNSEEKTLPNGEKVKKRKTTTL